MGKMTYSSAGVDYAALDAFKRLAQLAARATASNISRLGLAEVEMSRGESAYLIEAGDSFIAHVEEGLGTKNLVADAVYRLTWKSYYNRIGQDAVAMIVNDTITLGALPISVSMHLAVGASDWFNDEARSRDLVEGWKLGCLLAGCAWGGGETPTLKDTVSPETFVLSGSAIGLVKPKERLIRANMRHGDAIVLISSSGIHANGLTIARRIADQLPDGYLTKMVDGRTYGEALLEPTVIYVSLMEDCMAEGVDIHYSVHITGHGWRKLMRANETLAYVVERLPQPLPIFDFIQQHGPVDDGEAYGNFNMGAGFALYLPQSDVNKVLRLVEANNYLKQAGINAFHAGHIESSTEKKVVIKPKGLEYLESTLAIR